MAGDHPIFLIRAKSPCLVVRLVVEPFIALTPFTACLCNGLRAGGLYSTFACKSGPLKITSLDEFIDARLGRNHSFDMHQSGPSDPDVHQPEDIRSRSARIRAFRAQQQAHKQNISRPSRPSASLKAVHLLSAEEIKSLFHDVTSGLAFLVRVPSHKRSAILTIPKHEKSILHLDLKPGNVLLTWDEGKLIPRAMLSDFGTSQDMLNSRTRSGNTGTLEYASPESLPSPQTGKLAQMDSKSDIWSLGMILHKLLFFHLPYIYASGGNGNSAVGESDKMRRLEREILEYSGY
jgi:hypothetical protein